MVTFGRDVPLHRPDPGKRAVLFVPRRDAGDFVLEALKNGSGMAGFANPDRTITVYFENNKFSDPGLFTWESKVLKAYDRMVHGAPTVNKLTCGAGNLLPIGVVAGAEIEVDNMEALIEWLERSGALDSRPAGPQAPAGPDSQA